MRSAPLGVGRRGEDEKSMVIAVAMSLVVVASLLFHLASPWRATPIASNWGFIDDTLGLTFLVTTTGFVAVIMFLAYCLYRFHHAEGRRAEYEPENQKLEAWLAGVTTLAVIALLAPGLIVWDQFIHPPKDATEIEAFGVQWNWSFRLPGADGKLGSSDVRYIDSNNPLGVSPADPKSMDDIIITNGELHLPLGKPVKVLLRSADVLHDFYIPEIRAKMDLVPGLVSYLWFTPTKTGEYDILCAAYCGMGHPQMRGKLVVETEADYQKWLVSQQTFLELRKAQTKSEHEARNQ
jgi:cytochrome c oxidase subunit 2